MPNLYFKIDIDTEVFIEGGKKKLTKILADSELIFLDQQQY